ncbi:MAG: alanine racemase [Firmicutes bacterium]|nr:alanine racemase [Bacillota bacterium]
MGNILRNNWIEVDLDAYARNVKAMKRFIGNVKLCSVVKADAYGHGAVEISKTAVKNGADMLAVALVEEGIQLRESGIKAPILLLSEPARDAISEAIAHGLTLTLYTPQGASQAAAAYLAYRDKYQKSSSSATDNLYNDQGKLSVHIKADTGMHRVGVSKSDLPDLLNTVFDSGVLEVKGFWSHLAAADDVDNPFTALQLERFRSGHSVLADLMSCRNGSFGEQANKVTLHIANSAGTIYHPEALFDMVRLGIVLYGYPPGDKRKTVPQEVSQLFADLTPVLSWKTKVHFVREVAKGEGVSYGPRTPLESDSAIAVIPAGYHDGIRRGLFKAGGDILIKGKRRKIVGQVTMDQVMVTCGEDFSVKPGDEAVILGRQGEENITAEELADKLDTISYEILCGIGPRVPRIYIGTGGTGGTDEENISG